MNARAKAKEVKGLELNPKTNDDNQVTSVEETTTFQLGPKDGQITQLGNQLPKDDNNRIQQVIQEHADLFTWSAANMPVIDSSFCRNKASW